VNTLRRRRRGITLIELLFAMAIFAVLFLMVWAVFRSGQRQVASTRKKLDATQVTHMAYEALRHELEGSPWAWAPPVPVYDVSQARSQAPGAPPPAGVKRSMVVGGHEYVYDADSGKLAVNGRDRPGIFGAVHFWNQSDFRVKFLLRADESGGAKTGMNPTRERSTLVSKVFLENQAEEVRHRHHVWEEDHGWCVAGGSIHYGFTE
jgi:prepilin-type N-terminal cleavage/methylation domain-containing protein